MSWYAHHPLRGIANDPSPIAGGSTFDTGLRLDSPSVIGYQLLAIGSSGCHSLIPPWRHPSVSAKGARGRLAGCTIGIAAPGDVACGREARNWSETFLSAIASAATDSIDNLSKDFR
jgi:hypothetical protein